MRAKVIHILTSITVDATQDDRQLCNDVEAAIHGLADDDDRNIISFDCEIASVRCVTLDVE